MKKIIFLILITSFVCILQAQTVSIGLGMTSYHEDNIKEPWNGHGKVYIPSIDLRYKQEVSDGHHILVYAEAGYRFQNQVDHIESEPYGIRAGFTFFLNAIPFYNPDDKPIEIRALFGMGWQYDSYWETGDFIPVVKLHMKYKKLLLELGVQTNLIEAYYYTIVPELRLGIYYDLFGFGK